MGKSSEIQKHTDKYTLIGALDPDTKEIKPLSLDDGLSATMEGLNVLLHVWNSGTMDWEKFTGLAISGDDLTITMGDVEKLLADNYWHDTRYDFTGNNPIYIGKHTTHDVATSDTGWFIWKFSWSGNNPTRKEGPLVGSWDGRAGLGWG